MEFAGCYLLRSLNPSFRNHCYVGFTIDPPHRLKQHNGEITGGAFLTHSKRPWEMALVVYGFQTRKYALRFEWSWQHPREAKRLKEIDWTSAFKKLDGPRKFRSHVHILKEMLNMKPWSRLSLRICVTCADVLDMLRGEPSIPGNHRVAMGTLAELPVEVEMVPTPGRRVPSHCVLCISGESPPDPANWVICPYCSAFLHLRCTALHFVTQSANGQSALIPTDGFCPACRESLNWRDLVELRNQFGDADAGSQMINVV